MRVNIDPAYVDTINKAINLIPKIITAATLILQRYYPASEHDSNRARFSRGPDWLSILIAHQYTRQIPVLQIEQVNEQQHVILHPKPLLKIISMTAVWMLNFLESEETREEQRDTSMRSH